MGAAERKPQVTQAEWEQSGAWEINGLTWTIAGGAILLTGAFLRIYDLALRPLHHDEGVNGFFLQRLIKEGLYHYDPTNYHGPTLYYFTLAGTSLNSFFQGHSGLSTIAVRLVPALFGVATIWLVLCLRRYIGSTGALVAAMLLALSPGAVFMSRYFIHESLFAFFTLAMVVAWLKYYDGRSPAAADEEEPRAGLEIVILTASALLIAATLGAVYWPAYYRLELILLLLALATLLTALWLSDGECATYLCLASISAALLFATKETAMISAGVLLIAVTMGHAYLRFRRPPVFETKKKKQRRQRRKSAARGSGNALVRLQAALDRFGGPRHVAVLLVAALAIFVFVSAIFYSSFFTNAKGLADAFETFKVWTKTGMKDHASPWYQFKYVRWLAAEESPLLLLGGVGVALAVWRPTSRFVVVAALWAFGITAAYSLIPYKTPWLMLNFLVPLAIIGGYAVETFYRLSKDRFERLLVLAITMAALGVGAYQTVSLNFFNYDDEKYIYVYAHTQRGFLPLVDEVHRMAKQAGTGTKTGITVTAPDYWPLPWYLRDYEKVGYFGRLAATNEPLIICTEPQEAELKSLYGIEGRYRRINAYPLRPSVNLVLYVRRDVLEAESGASPAQ